jgi:hypothetical protein
MVTMRTGWFLISCLLVALVAYAAGVYTAETLHGLGWLP